MPHKSKGRSLQSAIEYLTTYGWAIIIIVVVLSVLYQLGIFSPYTFAPRMQPGSCNVYRPNGPNSSALASLAGACNRAIPQFTAKLNGQSSYVNAGAAASLNVQNAITVGAWVNPSSIPSSDPTQQAIYARGTPYSFILLSYVSGRVYALESCSGSSWNSYYQTATGYLKIGTWTYVAATYDSTTGNVMVYVNGNVATPSAVLTGSSCSIKSSTPTYLGRRNDGYYFNGGMANVQLYNTSLAANDIAALYSEGIIGAPINLQNLVAWWPLNGDTNDYSGDVLNGVPSNIVFTSAWTSGYLTH